MTFIPFALQALELPLEYHWVVKSGSGVGFHIWIRVKALYNSSHSKTVYKFPGKQNIPFEHLEYRENQHIVIPPSIHPVTDSPYVFWKSTPTSAPDFVPIEKVQAFVEEYCLVEKAEPKKEGKQNSEERNEDSDLIDRIQRLVNSIVIQKKDITIGYEVWLRLGFALASIGEKGREFFHGISQFNSRYDSNECDRQFDKCLKDYDSSEIKIGTFFHVCKEHGLFLTNEANEKAAKEGRKEANKQEAQKLSNPFDSLTLFFETHYPTLRRNEITGFLENEEKCLSEQELNSIFIRFARWFKKARKSDFETFLNSAEIPSYNPLTGWFEERKELPRSNGYIEALANAIRSTTGLDGDGVFYPNYVHTFLQKWLIGLVASLYGTNFNLLFPVLVGPKNTGKTEFWRRLLPSSFNPYYAESKFDAEKDSQALMCEKWLIQNDELDSMTKYEAKTFRNFISASSYTYRPPYGKQNVTRKRIASLCGSSNDDAIITDPENNRRIIPIRIQSIDFEGYNVVNKESLLMEAWWAYQDGEKWELTKEEIKMLEESTVEFGVISTEEELILKLFKPAEESEAWSEKLTVSEIIHDLSPYTRKHLSVDAVGRILKRLGFKGGRTRGRGRFYEVIRNKLS